MLSFCFALLFCSDQHQPHQQHVNNLYIFLNREFRSLNIDGIEETAKIYFKKTIKPFLEEQLPAYTPETLREGIETHMHTKACTQTLLNLVMPLAAFYSQDSNLSTEEKENWEAVLHNLQEAINHSAN